MKIVCLGDIHGRDWWRDIIETESDADLFIFHGDYVASHDGIPGEEQIRVLTDILNFKEENPDKVILLRGNHDLQHIGYYWAETCSFNGLVYKWFRNIDNKERFLNLTQWIYIDEDLKTVFSHSGISEIWLKNSQITDIHNINNEPPSELFGFTADNYSDRTGTSKTQPPVWIRPTTLYKYMVPGYHQVVGHTPMKRIVNIKDILPEEDKLYMMNDLWCIDTLLEQYLVIDNGEFIVKTI